MAPIVSTVDTLCIEQTSPLWGVTRWLILSSAQREGYPETRIFCSDVGYVLAQTICLIFCKHEVQSKLMLTSC